MPAMYARFPPMKISRDTTRLVYLAQGCLSRATSMLVPTNWLLVHMQGKFDTANEPMSLFRDV